MKFVANCGPQEPTAEFSVEIDRDGDPTLCVEYNGSRVPLVYFGGQNSEKRVLVRYRSIIDTHRRLLSKIGIDADELCMCVIE